MTQLAALAQRDTLIVTRRPRLLLAHLGASVVVAGVCAWAFWGVTFFMSSGVLQRIGERD